MAGPAFPSEQPSAGVAAYLRPLLTLAVFAVALVLRLALVPDVAYDDDLRHFARWARLIEDRGVFAFYDSALRTSVRDRTYPPLSTLALSAIGPFYGPAPDPDTAVADPRYLLLLKALPIASELALIAAVAVWLRHRAWFGLVIPALLAVHPALIATSAWWGQQDAPYTLLLVLALLAFNRDRPLAAWVFFAVALVLKQQAFVLGPLLAVVGLRRYGWVTTLTGLGLVVLINNLFYAPFALTSGVRAALSPYLDGADAFPFFTNNAYNFWFGVGTLHRGAPLEFRDPAYVDTLPLWGPLTVKTAGLILFGAYGVLVLLVAWRQALQRREFVWATALYLGFFVLLTQVHERYLYPATVLALIGVAQDGRLAALAVGLMWTYTVNILGVVVPERWNRGDLGIALFSLPAALLNVALLAYATRVLRAALAPTTDPRDTRMDPVPALVNEPGRNKTDGA